MVYSYCFLPVGTKSTIRRRLCDNLNSLCNGVTWQWCDGQESWHSYDIDVNNFIESAYNQVNYFIVFIRNVSLILYNMFVLIQYFIIFFQLQKKMCLNITIINFLYIVLNFETNIFINIWLLWSFHISIKNYGMWCNFLKSSYLKNNYMMLVKIYLHPGN